MAQYQLADGTLVDDDGFGNVTVIAAPNGAPPPPIDTTIVKSFLTDAFGALGAAIRKDFKLPPATPAPTAAAPATAASSLQKYLPVITLGSLALLAYKAFK